MKTNKKNLSKKELKERKHRHWVIGVSIGTFFSTMLVTYISDTLLAHTGLLISFLILFAIIAFGILADIVGVAVTAVNIEPFNAMAAKKLRVLRQRSLWSEMLRGCQMSVMMLSGISAALSVALRASALPHSFCAFIRSLTRLF